AKSFGHSLRREIGFLTVHSMFHLLGYDHEEGLESVHMREKEEAVLTRLGFGSKAVITGDVTQIDLPDARRSGLVEAARVLRQVEDIAILRFSEKDVVRHRLVQEIIKAYEKYSEEAKKKNGYGKG
ncbi:MAG: rRNA maturation RNase YbeY, partial [Oscillospiraceae bacterium]|nr:rRNA maturation RNase YbeY [Oscillospiraceae bacterium]